MRIVANLVVVLFQFIFRFNDREKRVFMYLNDDFSAPQIISTLSARYRDFVVVFFFSLALFIHGRKALAQVLYLSSP